METTTTTPRSKRAASVARPPKGVLVGPYLWRMEYLDAEGDETVDFGSCQYSTLTLVVRVDVAPQALINSVFHELWHAIHEVAGLNDGSPEEDYANRASQIFQGVYFSKENRPFWRWLTYLQTRADNLPVTLPPERVVKAKKAKAPPPADEPA